MPSSGRATVSIGIPSYNQADFIGPCIESILHQTYRASELIVIDDASDDDTFRLADEFSREGVKVLRNHKRVGATENHNRCLREATGQRIVLVHGDDLLVPDGLASLMMGFGEAPDAVLTFGLRRFKAADLRRYRQWIATYGPLPAEMVAAIDPGSRAGKGLKLLRGSEIVDYHLDHDLALNFVGEPANVCFDRRLALEIGGFREASGQLFDLDMWLRLLCHGDAVAITEPVAIRRLHARMLTHEATSDPRTLLHRQWLALGLLEVERDSLRRRRLASWLLRHVLGAVIAICKGAVPSRREGTRKLLGFCRHALATAANTRSHPHDVTYGDAHRRGWP